MEMWLIVTLKFNVIPLPVQSVEFQKENSYWKISFLFRWILYIYRFLEILAVCYSISIESGVLS